MAFIPGWIYRLMGQERARISGVVKIEREPRCLANLCDITFQTIGVSPNNYTVCVASVKSMGKEEPSRKYCPDCQYSVANVRKKADERLADAVSKYAPK